MNGFKYIIIFLIWSATENVCMAQQEVMFTQYMFNGLALNPAYAGSHEAVSMTVLAREQWTGIEGAPSTQTFSIHSPINRKKIALGLQVIHDKITVFNQYSVNASYAYRIRTDRGVLSLGLQGGFSSYQADLTKLTTEPGATNAFASDVSKFLPNLGAGIYYYDKKYYWGFSVPQLISNGLSDDIVGLDSDAKQVRHYFFTTGMVIGLDRNVKLKPNILVKAVTGAPVEVDLNVNALFHDVLWLGVSWRSFADIDLLMEMQLTNQLILGYSYDLPVTSELQRVNSGSHEIMLNYRLRYAEKRVINPRIF